MSTQTKNACPLCLEENGNVSGDVAPIKVLHIINSLGVGGAELALYRLLTHADPACFHMQVVTLLPERPLGEQLRQAGYSVQCLNMSKRRLHLFELARLVRILRKEKPDIVQTWLQQSDLIGGLAAWAVRAGPVLWNIRHSTMHPRFSKRRTRLLTHFCAKVSSWLPTRIVCCSHASREEQIKLGYTTEKMVVIPNGVDISIFKPDQKSREALRLSLGISEDDIVFGAAGRFHPAKDHRSLIEASAAIAARCPKAHFVFFGEGMTLGNPELGAWITDTGFATQFHLLGMRKDVPACMAALDVFISSSCFSEGFPNVVSEAMACGVTCIVTDVGDSARIVGMTGVVVQPGKPAEIASAALDLVRSGADLVRARGNEARHRIREHFSLATMIRRYEDLYTETALSHSMAAKHG